MAPSVVTIDGFPPLGPFGHVPQLHRYYQTVRFLPVRPARSCHSQCGTFSMSGDEKTSEVPEESTRRAALLSDPGGPPRQANHDVSALPYVRVTNVGHRIADFESPNIRG